MNRFHTLAAFQIGAGIACIALTGCLSPQGQAVANAAAPAIVQGVVAVDPSLKPTIAQACAAAVAGTDVAVAASRDNSDAVAANTLAHAACDTPTAQQQLQANDQDAAQPDGGSAQWLTTLLTAAKFAVALAPLL